MEQIPVYLNAKYIMDDAYEAALSVEKSVHDNPHPNGSKEYHLWREAYLDELENIYDQPGYEYEPGGEVRNIHYYLDRAKEIGLKTQSNRELSKKLGLANNAVCGWESGKTFPSPETMVVLAKLGEIAPEIALTELSYWKAGESSKSIYGKILNGLKKGAAVVALVLAISSNPANAAFSKAFTCTSQFNPLYIITF